MKNMTIVLALPRTGSSLIMQTLKILGKSVIGDKYRDDLPVSANPKGYYEYKKLLSQGLIKEITDTLGDRLDDSAVKIAATSMLLPVRGHQWKKLEKNDTCMFITYRHPLEIAVSHQKAFYKRELPTKEYFIDILSSLYKFRFIMFRLAYILTEFAPGLLSRTKLVGYHEHLTNPERFVEDIRTHAGLPFDRKRAESALKNIDTGLHRVVYNDLSSQLKYWHEKSLAGNVYDILEKNPTQSVWTKLLSAAPSKPHIFEPMIDSSPADKTRERINRAELYNWIHQS